MLSQSSFRLKFVFALVVVAVTATSALAQRTVSTRNLFWGAVVFNYQFSERYSLVSDAVFRFELQDGDIFQAGIRSGLQYTTSKAFQWTAGGYLLFHYPNPNGIPARPELRPWQDFGKKFEVGIHHLFFPRIRFEQRFFKEYSGVNLADEFTFHSFRLRLRVEYFYLFGDPDNQRWSFILGEEFLFHRRENGFTSQDQNRIWTGFAYKFNPVFTAQLTYLHINQQRAGTIFDQFHVIRLTLQFTGKKRLESDASHKSDTHPSRTFAGLLQS